MKAAQINEYGGPDKIKVNQVDKPSINVDQVLVEVHAASLNPFDTMVREGKLKDAVPLEFPITLAGDIAGIVAEVGENVSDVQVGEKVYGQAHAVGGNSGALAEYAATNASQIATMPNNLNFEQAASLPLVAASAWQAIVEHIGLTKGQKLFIHGGAGGIGTIAIQIAKNLGAYVATTATGEGIDMVKKLQADEIIDYKSEDFTNNLKEYDAVFDTTNGSEFNKAIRILKTGGVGVSMLVKADEELVEKRSIKAITQSTKVTSEVLKHICELVETGVVTPQVGKVFSLSDIQQAFTARENGQVNGKVVVSIS